MKYSSFFISWRRVLSRFAVTNLVVVCSALPAAAGQAQDPGIVSVQGSSFVRNGEPYRFVGVNMWYAAYLGADASFGDRERLVAELDLLNSLGVKNLRILGASEDSPYGKSLKTTFRDASDDYNDTLLEGLDFALAEIGKRDMTAVVYLNNFWEWSGGMGTYLSWVNGGEAIDLGDSAHPWPAFPRFVSGFYENDQANALYQDYIRTLLSRTNSLTGVPYKEEPAIMSWQLANEPRPNPDAGEGDPALDAFYDWADETADLIKDLDPNHLVSTGNEGTMGCNGLEACVTGLHASDSIDYLTFHMWPRNWSWFDPFEAEASFGTTVTEVKGYIDRHLAIAKADGRPIVLEEFGLDRADEVLRAGTPSPHRDRLLELVFAEVEESAAGDGPFAGTNLWAWGGYGRAQHEDGEWRPGDTSFTGDPPQEPQGRNSIFDEDASTLAIIERHASRLHGSAE
ncbi:glycoside hydrolase 5 family protein [Parvularcula dongshanensis]|uniref:mannan endo-1,4-beta-mannosidase n=1 Tax=Parvularcula dongshanensis TaxID=1173995 RepID=A0A840I8D6_9PROT|nr:cellulase family glycosylhydrolase [Parvularcula dongshanensis]MBB4660368.1 mannan endo-1,4-beta-mannosidase [Parvularcula dongshanensis]